MNHHTLLSLLAPAFICGLVAGVLVVVLLLGELAAWLLRVLVPASDDQATLARALATGLRERRPLAEVLSEMVGRVRFPYNRRLERAAQDAADDPRHGLGSLIARHRLFGRRLGRAVTILADTHPGRVLDLLRATPSPGGSDLLMLCCLYLLYLNVFAAVLVVIVGMVGPKYDQILAEMGIQAGPIYDLFRHGHGLLVFGLWMGLTLLILFLGWQHLRSPAPGRYQRGRLLLDGLLARRVEAELVEPIAEVWPDLRGRLAAPAAAGDTAGLIRACGWRASEAAGLARELDRYRHSRRRLHAFAVLALRCLLPCLFGGLVLLAMLAFYKETILRITESLL